MSKLFSLCLVYNLLDYDGIVYFRPVGYSEQRGNIHNSESPRIIERENEKQTK
jgi:hypothetical protein